MEETCLLGEKVRLARQIEVTRPRSADADVEGSSCGTASPLVRHVARSECSSIRTNRWMMKRLSCRITTMSPGTTCSKFALSIVSLSPGQMEGSILAPQARNRTVPPRRRTSAARSSLRLARDKGIVDISVNPYEVWRLKKQFLWVGCIFPQDSAMVSKTFSCR